MAESQPTIKLTPMEQAMTWERMSGERLSDTERQRIMQGGDFHPPTGTTLDPELEAWIHQPLTPEQWADMALSDAHVKKTKRPFLRPHIARVIRQAIESDRYVRNASHD